MTVVINLESLQTVCLFASEPSVLRSAEATPDLLRAPKPETAARRRASLYAEDPRTTD